MRLISHSVCQAGTIYETGETGENDVWCPFFWFYHRRNDPMSGQIEFLAGLTGLPPFALSVQEWDLEAGPNKLSHCSAVSSQVAEAMLDGYGRPDRRDVDARGETSDTVADSEATASSNRHPTVVADHAFEVPIAPGVRFRNMVTVSLALVPKRKKRKRQLILVLIQCADHLS